MDGYRLYSRRQTGGMAIEATFAEIGIPCEVVTVPNPGTPDQRTEYARINPCLQVPALVLPDGTIVTEGPAILMHLADAFPAAQLIPAPGSSRRGRHDRWLSFFQANVYEGMLRELFPDRYTTNAAEAAAVKSAATDYVRRHFLLFEQQLGEGPYLLGDAFTVFDIYLWMLCFWIDQDWLSANCPGIHRLWSKGQTRPALARIGAQHFS